VAALLLTVPSLDEVFDRFADMRPGWVVAAVLLELLSCLAFVAVFRLFFDTVASAMRAASPGPRWHRARCSPAPA